ncbi:MAG: dihydroorotate dehydrogenase, partial [Thermoleophilia bacterium]|nr:dihydroorotate dehydrogenase [Thermoleophilia bacterium]
LGRLPLKNPVVVASGEWSMTAEDIRLALDAGAAAVVAKSTNESPAAKDQLESAAYVMLDEHWRPTDGPGRATTLFNRSGLVREPFARWVETLAAADRYARERDAYVAASLIPADADELPRLAAAFEDAGLRWLELNLGASHGEEARPGTIELVSARERVEALVGAVRDVVGMHLTVKLAGGGDVVALAAAAREAGADSLALVGRPLAFLPDLETRRPLLDTFGAVGGAWALPLTLRWIAKARARFGGDAALLATNGVRDGADIARALLAGAVAVELGTLVWMEGPEGLERALGELARYLDLHGLAAREIIGQAADAVMTYEEAGARR